jgi:hypothetical protein
MAVTTFKIGKAEFVILPKRRYEQLTRAEQDRKDAETARKVRAAFLSGKVKGVPLAVARRRWGV